MGRKKIKIQPIQDERNKQVQKTHTHKILRMRLLIILFRSRS